MKSDVFADYINDCVSKRIEPSWKGFKDFRKDKTEESEKVSVYDVDRKIVAGVLENEFCNIAENSEDSFCSKDLEYKQAQLMTEIILKALEENMTDEQLRLSNELSSALADEWIILCKFYFRKGVRAGLTNLKFLNEINYIGCYID